MRKLTGLLPEIIVFLSGAATMMAEITGSRVIGPYIGTSVIVWSSLIGIIMASLSLGYWAGGLLADRKPLFSYLGWILTLSLFFFLLTIVFHDKVMRYNLHLFHDIRVRSVVAATVLFGPMSLFLGMVLPYCVRLKLKSKGTTGHTVGNLYMLSAAGSLAGTLFSGFHTLPDWGYAMSLYFTAFLILVQAAAAFTVVYHRTGIAVSAVLLVILAMVTWFGGRKKKSYTDIDTRYNRVLVYETTDKTTGRPVRMLNINDEKSSAMFLDGDDLVFEVLKYYRLISHFKPDFDHCLMIGGSGYAFPKDYLKKYPYASLDVVEIDPRLTDIAKKYFYLPDDERLRIVHEDGRTYMDRTTEKYDAIFMDAYKSMMTVPYQLSTRDCVLRMHDILNPGGVVLANIISTLNPANNHFLRAELATYRSVFPQVELLAVKDPGNSDIIQNFMLIALKSEKRMEFISPDPGLNGYLAKRVTVPLSPGIPVMTDELAPVDHYTNKVISLIR